VGYFRALEPNTCIHLLYFFPYSFWSYGQICYILLKAMVYFWSSFIEVLKELEHRHFSPASEMNRLQDTSCICFVVQLRIWSCGARRIIWVNAFRDKLVICSISVFFIPVCYQQPCKENPCNWNYLSNKIILNFFYHAWVDCSSSDCLVLV